MREFVKRFALTLFVTCVAACSQKQEAAPQPKEEASKVQRQEHETDRNLPSDNRLYRVGTNGDFHFVRSDGTAVAQAEQFVAVAENSCGEPRPVENKSHQWGYFTAQGIAIPVQFDAASCFSNDGFARVKLKGATGVIDKGGQWIVPLQRQVILISLDEGRLLFARQWENDSVVTPVSTAYGYFDVAGHVAIPPNLNLASPYSEGLAAVSVPNAIGIGYINRSGQLVIPWSYGEARPFREGLAAVQPALLKKWGFIDHTGARPIDARFDDAKSFNEDLAAVKENGKWGFINKNGDYVIQPKYDSAESFYGELARVSIGDKYFYIDKQNNWRFSALIESKALGHAEGQDAATPTFSTLPPAGIAQASATVDSASSSTSPLTPTASSLEAAYKQLDPTVPAAGNSELTRKEIDLLSNPLTLADWLFLGALDQDMAGTDCNAAFCASRAYMLAKAEQGLKERHVVPPAAANMEFKVLAGYPNGMVPD